MSNKTYRMVHYLGESDYWVILRPHEEAGQYLKQGYDVGAVAEISGEWIDYMPLSQVLIIAPKEGHRD